MKMTRLDEYILWLAVMILWLFLVMLSAVVLPMPASLLAFIVLQVTVPKLFVWLRRKFGTNK